MSDSNETLPAAEPEVTPPNPWVTAGTDPMRERDGAWVDDFIVPGWRVKIRSINALAVRKAQNLEIQKRRSIIVASGGVLDPKVDDEVNIALCRVLVTDWENIPDPADPSRMMDCTPDNVARAASHPNLGRQFRDEVLFAARQAALFRGATIEAMEKN